MTRWIYLTLCLELFVANMAWSQTVLLDGNQLTPQQVVDVAYYKKKVAITEDGFERIEKAKNILFLAAERGHAIYGLTQGVGQNKDQQLVKAEGGLSDEVVQASKKFNIGLIHAHSAGVKPELSPDIVRAIMVTRLNAIVYGATGAHQEVAKQYRDFLNNDIIPIVPSRGSLGEADITLITHIGLAMIGEGEVYYQGKRMLARHALRQANLQALEPYGQDSLTILNSNAYSEALAAITIVEMRHLAWVSKRVFGISLEALNGNIAPFLKDANAIRPFPYVSRVSEEIRVLLEGSYLWEASEQRELQDPLSYRTGAYIMAGLDRALAELETLIHIQLNSSDDNPGVILDVAAPTQRYAEQKLYVEKPGLLGAVIPTANFSPLPWVIAFERSGIALSHMSSASAQRTLKLSDDHFTHLTRFLATPESVHAYGAIQKVFVSLSAANRELANPVSLDYFAVAGNIEDVATNAPRVIRRVRQMVNNLYYILGIELLHATQAIDLRLQQNHDLQLSKVTHHLFNEFRAKVPFMKTDRTLTPDIETAFQFVRAYSGP